MCDPEIIWSAQYRRFVLIVHVYVHVHWLWFRCSLMTIHLNGLTQLYVNETNIHGYCLIFGEFWWMRIHLIDIFNVRHKYVTDLWDNITADLTNATRRIDLISNYVTSLLNKRPLGLTAPLSNNTLSMIYSPMNIKWPWFDLSMPPKVKCHDVNWKTIYRIWSTMCSWKIVYMMLH